MLGLRETAKSIARAGYRQLGTSPITKLVCVQARQGEQVSTDKCVIWFVKPLVFDGMSVQFNTDIVCLD